MQPLKAYLVTKNSTDHTVLKGDIIWLSENGDLNMGGGWLSKDEWDCQEKNDFTIKWKVLSVNGDIKSGRKPCKTE